jgi:hypothetical protein
MGFGVLEDRYMAAPPGTVTLGAANSVGGLQLSGFEGELILSST